MVTRAERISRRRPEVQTFNSTFLTLIKDSVPEFSCAKSFLSLLICCFSFRVPKLRLAAIQTCSCCLCIKVVPYFQNYKHFINTNNTHSRCVTPCDLIKWCERLEETCFLQLQSVIQYRENLMAEIHLNVCILV